jgi:hypothetical protein
MVVQLLSVYCAVIDAVSVDSVSTESVSEVAQAHAARLAAPQAAEPSGDDNDEDQGGGWRDSIRVLFARFDPAREPPEAVRQWRARARSVRQLRVLDSDLAAVIARLEATNSRLPPAQSALCGLQIGHLHVTPCL